MHHIVLSRRVSQLACIRRYASAIEGQNLPQNSVSSDGISPPPRIRRGPTDILQALASTVGPDPTAAHYKYHDDPYLIPLSNYRKRAYALSAEAGRKAAVWIRDEHAELFTTREWDPPGKAKTPYFNAEPIIEAFAPKPIYNNESKVTEDDLRYTIKNALLEDSVKVFQLLGGNEGINEELKMELLQLLCFYNEKEPETAEWLEERWFASNTNVRHSTTWKLGGLADKIFTSLEPKTSEAYCAIIQGMAKYYQAERAYVLTQEAVEKGVQLSTDVYNSLIGCVGFLKEGIALRTEELKSLLNEINIRGLSPNEATLTSCLRSISFWGGGRQLHQLALQVLAEFSELGFKPGLSDYYYLLCIFCKENGPPVDILTTILNDLESRDNLVAKEATDTNFFITAMGVCSDHLQNIELAQRLNALLMKGDNYKLVGDAYKESIYYRHYTTVTCRFASFDKAMEVLDTLVPNVYIPEPSVIREIIKTLEVNGAGERLAQTASQLIVFGHARRSMLVDRLLEAMCNCFHYQDDEVKGKMRSAAIELLNFGQIDKTLDTRSPVQNMSAVALCAIIEVCASCEDAASASWTAVSGAVGQLRAGDATGVPQRPQTLADVAARAPSLGLHQLAADIVWYLSECGFEEEARSASETALSAALGRPVAEVSELLQRPRDSLTASLHPSALQIYDAYQMATSSPQTSSRREVSSSSSESDGESSSDDEK